jgi:hypothetical protein
MPKEWVFCWLCLHSVGNLMFEVFDDRQPDSMRTVLALPIADRLGQATADIDYRDGLRILLSAH